MIYDLKPIPTKYAGVAFRSRLEARWAAFFDLFRVRWDYEPLDLPGWTPDFLLHTPRGPVLAEVKPVHLGKVGNDGVDGEEHFAKATVHADKCAVLLLGIEPWEPMFWGWLVDRRPCDDEWAHAKLAYYLSCRGSCAPHWAEAGNRTRWVGR